MEKFSIDTTKLEELWTYLSNTTVTNMNTSINSIYDTLNKFTNDDWSGESFDQFKTNCENYQSALELVPDIIQCFSDHLKSMVEPGNTLISEVKSCVDSMKV